VKLVFQNSGAYLLAYLASVIVEYMSYEFSCTFLYFLQVDYLSLIVGLGQCILDLMRFLLNSVDCLLH